MHAQQRVVVKIALLCPPGLECDLACQRCAQRLEDAAFHLRHDGVRMHSEDRVNDTDDAVHLDAAVLADRDLRDLRAHRVIELDDGDALMHAGGGLAPVGTPGRLVQHGQRAPRLRQQRAAKLVRVLLAGVRQFIDKGLAEEAVLRVVHGAPEADRDGGVAHHVADLEGGYGVAHVGLEQAVHHRDVLAVAHELRRQAGEDRRAAQAYLPADQAAVAVEAGGLPGDDDGPVEVVPHVLFARPDHLDRYTHGPGDQHRLARPVLR